MKNLNDFRENIRMANKHMNSKCAQHLIIRIMQTKIITRYAIRMAKKQKKKTD